VEEYLALLDRGVSRAYQVAGEARARGLDPSLRVEIPRAEDLASRVEELLLTHWPVRGIAQRIRELSRSMNREEVALTLTQELAQDESRGTLAERLEVALRVGLAILTEGILVAPLEGLAKVELRGASEGGYVDLYYAGPIRAAGGTAQALSVLMADVVRRTLGIPAYTPTPDEIERYCEEIPLYKHCQHLQYVPSREEIRAVVSRLPVCVNGEPTEGDMEVSSYRNLPRVGTNGLRGGACLVLAEGICQKASKLLKTVDKLGLTGWDFLSSLGRASPVAEEAEESEPRYLAEAVGGRPVLAHPHRPGGFRLVYGRSRTTGLAAAGVNPATMVLLRHFVAVGTQVKLELPGKAAAMALCDTVEGPRVLLDDGSFVGVSDRARAEELLPRVRRIVDLGEILISFGEFLENNHPLEPGAYTLPWHVEEWRSRGLPIGARCLHPSLEEAVEDARRYGVPLHPWYTLFWHDVEGEEIARLSARVLESGALSPLGGLSLPFSPEDQELLLRLGAFHRSEQGRLSLEAREAKSLLLGLGLEDQEGRLVSSAPPGKTEADGLREAARRARLPLKSRGPTRIGARVGRPEKANRRKMQPNVHALFPVGETGGIHRSLRVAAEAAGTPSGRSPAPVSLGVRRCPNCGREDVANRCPCGGHTEPTSKSQAIVLPYDRLLKEALGHVGLEGTPPDVQGVKGLVSESRTPEPLEKGLLRAAHGISVYQDGTARFDLTDLPLTHVRLREVDLSPEEARALGYDRDWLGKPLVDDGQLVELYPQDVVLSRRAGEYLLDLSHFLDEELRRLYGGEPFYRASRMEELRGELVIALAPHTSGGVLGRILGFTDAEACLAHPVFHAAKRRNCDGDEDSVTLLMDGLLNFSHTYLPVRRGALMDKPLVLTTRLDPREVDKEAHNVDVGLRYPLEVYRATEERRSPREVEPMVPTIGKRLPLGAAGLRGSAFTHDTWDLAGGPLQSAYREAMGMERTVEATLELAAQIRAVDLVDSVSRVLSHHFLPDIMGNLKSYATQHFRCPKCNASYRRPPLGGRCTRRHGSEPCGTALKPTVYPTSVTKYLPLARKLVERYGVSPYLRQRLEVLESSARALFPLPTGPGAPLERFRAPEPAEEAGGPIR
jgi:DNA polymerase II large subunit